MTDAEIQDFITQFAAAWAARDGEAFLALWHPDGVLRTPLVDRPIAGKELGRLNDVQREATPDLVWQLLDWSSRGDIVIIEWQCTRQVGGKRFDWRGVDKFRLRDGKIAEERVYMDTALLRALRSGVDPEPIRQAAGQGVAFEPLSVL
ncbi:Ketosteroid isomerase-related protein [Variovorax sp. CF079]|uniref:nuclear transport factor 2 family protein n=1 Tax=Variovorax sp. CF079 TaxID=1882774 RepID=UPI0008809D3D|nr:nuclear transport factor 2 family protein [Variovorax sp. CF079]SDC75235.1 Ketosteroid isomerase-related protein [Variovorax sp. CF079]